MTLTVPGYETIKEIAMGDLARVVKARHIESGAAVVIKWLHPDLLPDPAVREVFLQEVSRLVDLDQPGFVRTRATGVAGKDRVYVVQDYVPGRSTAEDVARRGFIPEAEALRWAREVAHALEQAWSRFRLPHAHLHPDNIRIDPTGQVRVADLGLSRLVSRLSAAEGTPGRSILRGTLHYLAPEQVDGTAALDARTDIHALGLVIYHWVTGQVPFSENWNEDVAERLRTGRLPELHRFRPGLSRGLETLLSGMTARDRARRYPGWAELVNDLSAVAGMRRPAHPPDADSVVPGPEEPRPKAPSPPTWPSRSAAGSEPGPVASGGARRIVLSRSEQRKLGRVRSPVSATGPSRVLVVGLLLTAGTFYALHRYGGVTWRDFFAASGPGRVPPPPDLIDELPQGTVAYRREREPAPAPARTPPAIRRIQIPEAASDPGRAMQTRDPLFLQGARGFNAALELYQQYQQDNRSDPALLRRIEEMTQEALRHFTTFQEANPDHREVAQYIDQCYGMIRYARQSLLMDHGLAGRTGGRSARDMRTAAEARTVLPGAALRLAAGWSIPPRTDERAAAEDMLRLLGTRGTAGVNLAAQPMLHVFPGVPYLVPAREAAARYEAAFSEGMVIRHPGFPAASVRVHGLEGQFPEGWTRLRLFTDLAGQVIAVQGVSETAGPPRLPRVLFSDRWQVFDLGSGRTKPTPQHLVAHRIRSAGSVVYIESELAEPDASAEGGVGEVVARMTLYLPQPIVDLMLTRLASR